MINRGREEGKGSSFQPDCHVIIAHMPAAFYRRDRSMYDCDMIPDRQVCCISCFSISIFFFHVKKMPSSHSEKLNREIDLHYERSVGIRIVVNR